MRHYEFSLATSKSRYRGLGRWSYGGKSDSRAHKVYQVSRQAGAVMIEASISFAVLLLVLLTGLALVLSLWRMVIVDHALARTARYAVTLPMSAPSSVVRVGLIESRLRQEIAPLGISLNQEDIFVCALAGGAVNATCSAENAGLPNEYLSISAQVPIRIPPLFSFNYITTVVGRNEPI